MVDGTIVKCGWATEVTARPENWGFILRKAGSWVFWKLMAGWLLLVGLFKALCPLTAQSIWLDGNLQRDIVKFDLSYIWNFTISTTNTLHFTIFCRKLGSII